MPQAIFASPRGGGILPPSTAVDNAIARFDESANALQSSGIIVDDSDNVSGINAIDTLTVTGDTSLQDITNVESIQLALTPTIPSHQTGLMHWSDENKCLEVGMYGTEVSLQVGLEQMFRATNKSTVDIVNGDVV